MTPEEQRALEYQAQQRRREAFQRSLQKAMHGSTAAYKALLAKWEPLRRS